MSDSPWAMSTDKNHFTIDFTDDTLKIRANGKLVSIVRKCDLTPDVFEIIFRSIKGLIRSSTDKQAFENSIFHLQLISVGPCELCGRHANLVGGMCYTCSSNETDTERNLG